MRATNIDADLVNPPHWPTEPVDPHLAWVDCYMPADAFPVYFGGKPVPAMSSSLDAPAFRDVAITIGLGADGKEAGQIVGVQVIPMLLGAVLGQPTWAALARAAMAGDVGGDLLQERLPGFLDDAATPLRAIGHRRLPSKSRWPGSPGPTRAAIPVVRGTRSTRRKPRSVSQTRSSLITRPGLAWSCGEGVSR